MPPKKQLRTQYTEDDDLIPYEQAIETIDKSYTQRIFQFMRGEVKVVSSSQEYVNMYDIMVKQCNDDMRAQRVYAYFIDKLTKYAK